MFEDWACRWLGIFQLRSGAWEGLRLFKADDVAQEKHKLTKREK